MIEQPFTGERYFADQNGSIYTGPEGERRLATRQCDALSNAILFTTSPHLFAGEEMEKYREIESQVRLFRYGCDCYAYALLAAGHDEERLYQLISNHLHYTGSARATEILDNWADYRPKFRKVMVRLRMAFSRLET